MNCLLVALDKSTSTPCAAPSQGRGTLEIHTPLLATHSAFLPSMLLCNSSMGLTRYLPSTKSTSIRKVSKVPTWKPIKICTKMEFARSYSNMYNYSYLGKMQYIECPKHNLPVKSLIPSPSGLKTIRLCKYEEKTIDCGNEGRIDIVWANLGQLTKTGYECNGQSTPPPATDCELYGSQNTIETLCVSEL